MAFGLTNAPATFQRLIESCLHDLTMKECCLYLDDIVVFSSTVEEHIERLQRVFQRLHDFGLTLNPSKCCFFKESVKYLGHIISAKGIQTDPDKIETTSRMTRSIDIDIDIDIFIHNFHTLYTNIHFAIDNNRNCRNSVTINGCLPTAPFEQIIFNTFK